MDKTMEKLKDVVTEEIDKLVKQGTLSPNELEHVHKALCVLEKIQDFDEYGAPESEYSERYGGRRYSRGMSRTDGSSRRGYDIRMMPFDNAYQSYPSRSYNSYERSGHSIKDRMIDKLESMMDEAGTEYERQMVSEWINRIEAEH